MCWRLDTGAPGGIEAESLEVCRPVASRPVSALASRGVGARKRDENKTSKATGEMRRLAWGSGGQPRCAFLGKSLRKSG
jgi:hypothetical protein